MKRRFDEASTSVQHRDPWPRDDKTPIRTIEPFADPKKAVISKECINRALTDDWDDYDSLFYNAWLGVSIEPTLFINPYFLRKLRIDKDIDEMITQLGLSTMPTHAYDLHVDLVRQFMATVEFTYNTSKTRVAGDGTLTFFARGIRYRISIPELCRIYDRFSLLDLGSQLSFIDLEKESIDGPIGTSFDTPFKQSIDATVVTSIDGSSSKHCERVLSLTVGYLN
ncbi:hypothetical protein IGI04_035691 [Brassica rapa subsp. trilocularis]|uniref:Arabidopsis retrotransposon Orf1 C-terminal domain-containing protein n=1 Tax=Brassica rapa subsp. trilocularis TaxID=1813537 RepID=A0ABQ7LEM8_BRACM|nr:hypothetical protein IGI04_035691 [Brassica rapa subsp. trilocularis]